MQEYTSTSVDIQFWIVVSSFYLYKVMNEKVFYQDRFHMLKMKL